MATFSPSSLPINVSKLVATAPACIEATTAGGLPGSCLTNRCSAGRIIEGPGASVLCENIFCPEGKPGRSLRRLPFSLLWRSIPASTSVIVNSTGRPGMRWIFPSCASRLRSRLALVRSTTARVATSLALKPAWRRSTLSCAGLCAHSKRNASNTRSLRSKGRDSFDDALPQGYKGVTCPSTQHRFRHGQQRCMQPHCWQLLLLCYITHVRLCKSQIEEVPQVLLENLPVSSCASLRVSSSYSRGSLCLY